MYLINNLNHILILTVLIVVGKTLTILFLGFIFPWRAQTVLVLAFGLSQIGEFSFILGQAGVTLGLLNQDQYSLLLAGSLFSITLNPMMYRLIVPTEKLIRKIPILWRIFDRHRVAALPVETRLEGHVVIVGYGRVGRHIVNLLQQLDMPYLVIESDTERIQQLNQQGTPTLYGDASNSEVLTHASLAHARALVVASADEAASELIVASARDIAPELSIIARAATEDGIKRLVQLGAGEVIHPELEGGLEIVRHTLQVLDFPLNEIIRYMDTVRHDQYDILINTEEEHRSLHDLIHASGSMEITWFTLDSENPIVGKTLAEADLRVHTGASVVAILRNGQIMANPKSNTEFVSGDRIGFIGDKDQIEKVEILFARRSDDDDMVGVEWET